MTLIEGELLDAEVTLHAMSLDVPDTPGHPNKHPFKGILTRIGTPSDNAPVGSGKKRVILTETAAKKALPTLLGMAVDLKNDLSGHDVKQKVGIITKANIEGDALLIEGFLYAADFPDEVARIQSEKDELGFSWEINDIYVTDTRANPLTITGCTFTGAAILYKDEAAYTTTQLAAQAEENFMDSKEIIEAFTKTLDEKLAPVNARLEKIEAEAEKQAREMQAGKEHLAKVEPHAAALERVADGMEKDGLGGGRAGHIKACRAMASHMRAEAAMGRLASEWPGFDGLHASAGDKADSEKDKQISELQDQVSSMTTQIKDLQAAAKKDAPAAERKTLSPHITALLAKGGVAIPTDASARLGVAEVDKALANANLTSVQRIEVKNGLEKAGLLAA